MLHLLLVIHNHQPLGNLPEVFKKGWDKAYGPFLDVIRKHPKINWSLHVSGPLWEWLESDRPEFFDIIKEQLALGRLELLTGAMWEPIQPIIDEESCYLQLSGMKNYLHDHFGVDPQGSWTTERVWEPFHAGRLARAGIKYTLLDDSQFRAALPPPSEHEVWGYYRTEHNGRSVAVFPIDERLRYLIPFRKAGEVMDYLEDRARILPDGASITYGDDGEKFGLWPQTYEWVFGKGWLDEFLGRLEASSNVVTTHPSKYMELQPHPRQRVYIPTSSYREMGSWTLYPAKNLAAEKVYHYEQSDPDLQKIQPPFAAGFFRNFLARYPESRYMQERVGEIFRQIVSRQPESRPSNSEGASSLDRALWHVLRAQCNCAYWHGVFGGLYLNYLRFAVHREVLKAEKVLWDDDILMPEVRYIGTRKTLQIDGKETWVPDPENEILISNRAVQWVIDPVTGQVVSAGSLEKAVDVIDVLARRFEAYHATMVEAAEAQSAGTPASIHDMREVAPKGWHDSYGYDPCRRGCFGDRAIAIPPSANAFARVAYKPDFNIDSEPWKLDASIDRVEMKKDGPVWARTKTFTFGSNGSTAKMNYKITRLASDAYSGFLFLEFNIGLLAGDASDRYHLLKNDQKLKLSEEFQLDGASEATLVDEWTGVRINIKVSGADWVGVYPVKTLSRSEAGLEMTYQGTCLNFRLPLSLNHGENREYEASMSVI